MITGSKSGASIEFTAEQSTCQRHAHDDAVLHANSLREMQRVQWLDWDWSTARGLASRKLALRVLEGFGIETAAA